MSATTSTTVSDAFSATSGWKTFRRQIIRFSAPYLFIFVALSLWLAATGEFLSETQVVKLQSLGYSFIYGPKFSDHTYYHKLTAARSRRPDVLVIGPSRMLQWRSAMFKPLSFYNAGSAAYVQQDFRRFLEDLGPYSPRVIIFPVDFFTLHRDWDRIFENRSYSDRGGIGSAEETTILRALLSELRHNPRAALPLRRDPAYGLPTLGVRAAEDGNGLRPDGSYHYGQLLSGSTEGMDSIADTLRRVVGGFAPFQMSDRLDRDRMKELERFAQVARSRGIRLIGVTLPYSPEIVNALDSSPRHGNWHEFQQPSTAAWLQRLNIRYFNFTRLESFGGQSDEFVDPFHVSEPACVRMLLKMLEDPVCHEWLTGIDVELLRKHLSDSTRLETYRNEF